MSNDQSLSKIVDKDGRRYRGRVSNQKVVLYFYFENRLPRQDSNKCGGSGMVHKTEARSIPNEPGRRYR